MWVNTFFRRPFLGTLVAQDGMAGCPPLCQLALDLFQLPCIERSPPRDRLQNLVPPDVTRQPPRLAPSLRHANQLLSSHPRDHLERKPLLEPLFTLFALQLVHVLHVLWIIKRVYEPDDSPFVRPVRAHRSHAQPCATEGRDIVGSANVGHLDAIDGRKVRAYVGLGDRGWDTERGFVRVVRFALGRVVAHHPKDRVGEVDFLADDPGALGGCVEDTAEAGTTSVESIKPFSGCGDVPVFLTEISFSELARVGGVFGGREWAVGRGEEFRVFLETARTDGEGGGGVTCTCGMGRECCLCDGVAGVEPTQDASEGLHGVGGDELKRTKRIFLKWSRELRSIPFARVVHLLDSWPCSAVDFSASLGRCLHPWQPSLPFLSSSLSFLFSTSPHLALASHSGSDGSPGMQSPQSTISSREGRRTKVHPRMTTPRRAQSGGTSQCPKTTRRATPPTHGSLFGRMTQDVRSISLFLSYPTANLDRSIRDCDHEVHGAIRVRRGLLYPRYNRRTGRYQGEMGPREPGFEQGDGDMEFGEILAGYMRPVADVFARIYTTDARDGSISLSSPISCSSHQEGSPRHSRTRGSE